MIKIWEENERYVFIFYSTLLWVAFSDLIFKWHFYPLTDSINQYFFHRFNTDFFLLALECFVLKSSSVLGYSDELEINYLKGQYRQNHV